jgi:hypothetical protein
MEITTRGIVTALAIALLATSAHAQGMGGGKGKRHSKDATLNAEDVAKKKAAEAAYEKALKGIPATNIKTDPWGNMR